MFFSRGRGFSVKEKTSTDGIVFYMSIRVVFGFVEGYLR